VKLTPNEYISQNIKMNWTKMYKQRCIVCQDKFYTNIKDKKTCDCDKRK
jgi:hypothetical protein